MMRAWRRPRTSPGRRVGIEQDMLVRGSWKGAQSVLRGKAAGCRMMSEKRDELNGAVRSFEA